VCGVCGGVAEIAAPGAGDPGAGDCGVADWAAEEAARRGFAVDGHELTVHGTCAACRGGAPASGP
jgi:Fe2+ or Zn2+ uptake regulation protein